MGINSKDVGGFMLKILKFFINSCCRFVQKYPFVSGVLLSLLALYLFLPSIFFLLIYSSPFIACTAIFLRFYYSNSSRPKIQNSIKVEQKDHGISDKDHKFSIETQPFLERNKEFNKEERLLPTGSNDDISITTAPSEEEKPDNIAEMVEGSVLLNDGQEEQSDKFQGLELESSSSEEDEAKMNRNQAVEWTENDQKNLMDLGSSEIERNRRLESLIARRKVRKSFKFSEKDLIKMEMNITPTGEVSPVIAPTISPFHVQDDQMPGSAPSILLPNHNPFDIPYDSSEEKPNLTGDSFQQEFMDSQQKDIVICRHQSFSVGPYSPLDSTQDHFRGLGPSRFRPQLDKVDYDQLVEDLPSHQGRTLRRQLSVTDLVTQEDQSPSDPEDDMEGADGRIPINDVNIQNAHESEIDKEIQAIKHEKSESSATSSDEDDDPEVKGNRNVVSENLQAAVFKFPQVFNNPAENSLRCPIPKAKALNELPNDSSLSPISNGKRIEEHLFLTNNKSPWHTPTNSIASDMQVEVSETGSPPLTVDGNDSSNDDKSLTYDGDVEKEITSGSEDMWGASPHPTRSGEQNLTFRDELNELGEDYMTEGKYLGGKKDSEDPIASSFWSYSNSTAQIPPEDHKLSVSGQRPTSSSDVIPPENSLEGIHSKESMIQAQHGLYLEKTQEWLNPSGKSAEEVSINSSASNDNLQDLKSVENKHGISEKSNKQEVLEDLSKPTVEHTSESGKHVENNSDIYANYQATLEPVNKNFQSTEETEDRHEQQSASEFQGYGVNQNSNDPDASSKHSHNEFPHTNSSSSLSPTSVFPDAIRTDQHINVLESDTRKNIMTDNLLDVRLPENVHLNTPEDAQHAVEDAIDHQAIGSNPGKSEEPSNTREEGTDEVKEMQKSGIDNGERETLMKNEVAAEMSKETAGGIC